MLSPADDHAIMSSEKLRHPGLELLVERGGEQSAGLFASPEFFRSFVSSVFSPARVRSLVLPFQIAFDDDLVSVLNARRIK